MRPSDWVCLSLDFGMWYSHVSSREHMESTALLGVGGDGVGKVLLKVAFAIYSVGCSM